MSTNKKPTLVILALIAIVIIGAIFWRGQKGAVTSNSLTASTTETIAVSETTKISSTLSSYQNSELGFSVKYPSTWIREETGPGVTFSMPIDKSQVSTISTLQASAQALAGKCAFPPITTIKDRGTIKVGTDTLDMISMSNTVQNKNYMNRMYSLQKGDICYMFSFASISVTPSSKGLTGSNATQAQNNNQAIQKTADADFTTMVKSFALVTSPEGKSETEVAPKR